MSEKNKNENGFASLIFNILLPVLILHKLSIYLGPLPALILALSFPLGFGIWDFYRKKKLNPLSALGFVNVSVTGSLAVLGLGGIWFSIKEAVFPGLIGLFVLFSAFSQKPFIQSVFLNPQLIDLDAIQNKLSELQKDLEFKRHLRLSTIFLSLSFFISAALNFFLSLRIFKELDPNLDANARALQLNSQIAEMTQWSFVVIMLPSLICLSLILWHLIQGIRNLTGLKTDQILKS